jgi:hypothetical protein
VNDGMATYIIPVNTGAGTGVKTETENGKAKSPIRLFGFFQQACVWKKWRGGWACAITKKTPG